MQRKITARIESIDVETGVFPMTLATEGEAHDGHILSIRGAVIPDPMPLMMNHALSDVTKQLGSIVAPTKNLRSSPPALLAEGRIEMGGDGVLAEIRRDIAHMMGQGHMRSVSVQWDPTNFKATPRATLPKDHPHFVDPRTEKRSVKRSGLFFEEWHALEGSVVPVGSDAKAIAGRSQETTGPLQTFWRSLAEIVEETGELDVAAALACLRLDARDCLDLGATTADLLNAVVDPEDSDYEPVELAGRKFFLPLPVAKSLAEERAKPIEVPDPAPTLPVDPPAAQRGDLLTPETIARMGEMMEASDRRWSQQLSQLVEYAQGKVKR